MARPGDTLRPDPSPEGSRTAGQFQVVRLGLADAGLFDGMLTLFGEVFEDHATYCGAKPTAGYRKRLLSADGFVALVSLKAGAVVGALAAYELVKFEQEHSEFYIYDLAVAAAHRRQGIATALIEELRAIAARRPCKVVFVQADHGDEPAISLYSKLGRREEVLHFDIEVGAQSQPAPPHHRIAPTGEA